MPKGFRRLLLLVVLASLVSCEKIQLVYAEKLHLYNENYFKPDIFNKINNEQDMSKRINQIAGIEGSLGNIFRGVKLAYGSDTKNAGRKISLDSPDYYCLEKDKHAEIYFSSPTTAKLEFIYNVKYDNGQYQTSTSLPEPKEIEAQMLCFVLGRSHSNNFKGSTKVHLYFNFFTDPSKISLKNLYAFSLERHGDSVVAKLSDKQAVEKVNKNRTDKRTIVMSKHVIHESSCKVKNKTDFKFLINGQELFLLDNGYFDMAFFYDRSQLDPSLTPSESDINSVSGNGSEDCIRSMVDVIFSLQETYLDDNLNAMEDLDSFVPKLLQHFGKLELKIPESSLKNYGENRNDGKIHSVKDFLLLVNQDIYNIKLAQNPAGSADLDAEHEDIFE